MKVSEPAIESARPLEDWKMTDGLVLWWTLSDSHWILKGKGSPYLGTPLDLDWPGVHTHWTSIRIPAPVEEKPEAEKTEGDRPSEPERAVRFFWTCEYLHRTESEVVDVPANLTDDDLNKLAWELALENTGVEGWWKDAEEEEEED